MPDVSPFRGVRYDVARVGTLSDVVAPPYDVIDTALQDRLYQASPYNVIRLELNRDEPGDSGPDDRYARAARILKDWLRQGILREEDHPAFYVYEQTFEVEGTKHIAQGVPGAGAARADRQGEDLSPRADLGRPQGRPAGSLQGHRVQPEPDLRALSRPERARAAHPRSRRCATALRWWRPTTWASRTGSGSSPTRRPTRRSRGLMAGKARLHRRRPPPLRDRPEVSGRARSKPARPSGARRPVELLPDDAGGHERPRALDPADSPAALGFPGPDRRRS